MNEISFLGLNILDFAVLIVLLLFAYLGYRKGLILTLFKLVSMLLSLMLTYYLQPYAGAFLKHNTKLPAILAQHIAPFINLESLIGEQTKTFQVETINQLQIPSFLKTSLLENNNSEIYKMFNISGLQDYFVKFLADMIINVIAVFVVFILVFMIMRLLTNALNIVSKLPVIRTFNRFGGILAGLVQATLIIWVCFLVTSFFVTSPKGAMFLQLMHQSVIAKYFYDTNVLFKMIAQFIH